MLEAYPMYITVEDACEILSVEEHSIYRLISEKQVDAIRVSNRFWRIKKDSLSAYILRESGLDIEMEDVNDYA